MVAYMYTCIESTNNVLENLSIGLSLAPFDFYFSSCTRKFNKNSTLGIRHFPSKYLLSTAIGTLFNRPHFLPRKLRVGVMTDSKIGAIEISLLLLLTIIAGKLSI